MNYSLGNPNPSWAKCLKSGQKISGSGQFFFVFRGWLAYLHSSCLVMPGAACFGRRGGHPVLREEFVSFDVSFAFCFLSGTFDLNCDIEIVKLFFIHLAKELRF